MNDLARLLLEARRAVAAELGADLEDRGYPDLRPADAAVFLAIDRRNGSRVSDLAAGARVSKQGMMAHVDDLEERGYVRRVPDPTDARAKLVRLTARGRRAGAECRRAVLALDQRMKRRLGPGYDLLIEALEEIVSEEAED